MEKIMYDYQGRFNNGRRYGGKNKRSMQPASRKLKSNLTWVPAIPSWEKEFCHKIGQFTWENFLEAKKEAKFSEKVMQWNDSAGEEAFYSAKKRFFAEINGLPIPDQSHLNPDLYIDEIDYEAEIDPELWRELEITKALSDEQASNDYYLDYHNIPIEDIKATGWDIPIQTSKFSEGNVLTGLILCTDE